MKSGQGARENTTKNMGNRREAEQPAKGHEQWNDTFPETRWGAEAGGEHDGHEETRWEESAENDEQWAG
jgi:hypothetical protein